MTHEQLIGLLSDPIFEQAKDYIREGISCKLLAYENKAEDHHKVSIDVKPRKKYFPPDLAIVDPENEDFDEKNPIKKEL